MIADDPRRAAVVGTLIALGVVLLAGCAAGAAPGSAPGPGPAPASAEPTCAVPVVDGEEPPDGCIGYDPDQSMADNRSYRDRVEIGAEDRAAGEPYAESVRVGLDRLQASGTISDAAVRTVLVDSGVPARAIQTLHDERGVEFAALLPESVGSPGVGVCVFGTAGQDGLSVDIGGVTLDGGCFPSRGGH